MTQKEMDKDMRNHDEHKQLTIRQPGRGFLATRHRACRPDHSTSEPGPEKSLSNNLFTVFRQVPAHCSGESMRQQTRVSPPLFAGFCSPSPSRRWLPNLKGLLVFFAIFGMLSTRAVSAQEPADSVPVLTLEQAVQLALTDNRSVRIASLEVDKSKWQIAEVKTKRLPSFSADIIGSQLLNEISYTFPEGAFGIYPGIGPIPSTDTKVTTPRQPVAFITSQASQPISQLYKIHLGIRSQEVSSQLNSEKLRATRQSVVKDVKQAYYAVLQSESALDAADASVKQYQLADEQYKLVQLRDTLDSRKEYLNDLLGRDIRTEFRTEQVPPASFEEVDLRFAQDRALAQRSEIKQAQLNVQQSEYARRLAKADYIPDFGVAFNYVSTFNVDVLPRNVTSLGFELKWEPWEWGRRRDVVNQKKIVETQAQTQLRDVQSKVLVDVNSGYRKLNESRMLIAVTQATRDAAQQRLREVRYRYEQQAVLLRDVLQQQSAVASAHDNYQQALLGFWTAKTDFEKSLGEDQ
jgi:outer membrane protein